MTPTEERGVFAALITETSTTITTANTYYPISGSFANSPLANFCLVSDPAIQYDDIHKWFEIDWHATAYADANNTTVHIGIRKNNQLLESSIMGTFLKTADEAQALSGTLALDLNSGDKVQLVVTSDGDGDIITFKHFTTTIREFF